MFKIEKLNKSLDRLESSKEETPLNKSVCILNHAYRNNIISNKFLDEIEISDIAEAYDRMSGAFNNGGAERRRLLLSSGIIHASTNMKSTAIPSTIDLF